MGEWLKERRVRVENEMEEGKIRRAREVAGMATLWLWCCGVEVLRLVGLVLIFES
jgi:hypothetical protein